MNTERKLGFRICSFRSRIKEKKKTVFSSILYIYEILGEGEQKRPALICLICPRERKEIDVCFRQYGIIKTIILLETYA